MLRLEVFMWGDEDDDEDGIETNVPMCNSLVEQRYFITIDSFAEYVDIDGNQYTSIYSGGQEWITMYNIKDFIELLTTK